MLQQAMRMRRLTALAPGFAVVAVALGAGCAQPAAPASLSHVDRVIEDVTAMIEGMVQAHVGPSGVAEIPDNRSSAPHS